MQSTCSKQQLRLCMCAVIIARELVEQLCLNLLLCIRALTRNCPEVDTAKHWGIPGGEWSFSCKFYFIVEKSISAWLCSVAGDGKVVMFEAATDS